jgi:hypothetical protein
VGVPALLAYRGVDRTRCLQMFATDVDRVGWLLAGYRIVAGQVVSERGFEPLRAAKLTRPST